MNTNPFPPLEEASISIPIKSIIIAKQQIPHVAKEPQHSIALAVCLKYLKEGRYQYDGYARC